uniref:Uncharacterized protein n=1 Tax=Solanum tuberosum TaxID=4113 RepID=M1DPG0_SOLTU
MPDETLLDCFYQGLEPENRSIAEHLFKGGMLNQPYVVIATLLDKMVETNKEAQKKYEWDKLVAEVNVLSKRVTGLEEKAREKEKNFSLQECKQGKRHEGVQSNDTSSFIQQKLDEHDKKLNDMKDNIDMLNEVTTLNSMTIQLQGDQLTHLIMDHYPLFAEDSPYYTMGDSEFEDNGSLSSVCRRFT